MIDINMQESEKKRTNFEKVNQTVHIIEHVW